MHVDPGAGWFPHYVGFADETGRGDGVGTNLNVPLAPGTGDDGWLAARRAAARGAASAFGATALVVSLGVDAAADDPESPLQVTVDGYHDAPAACSARWASRRSPCRRAATTCRPSAPLVAATLSGLPQHRRPARERCGRVISRDHWATIAVDGLSKDFGPVKAVDDLSFRSSRARVTGFLGPNGAGKTTTLRMLLGLVPRPPARRRSAADRLRDLPTPCASWAQRSSPPASIPAAPRANHLRVLCPLAGSPAAGRGGPRAGGPGRRRRTGGSARSPSACGSGCRSRRPARRPGRAAPRRAGERAGPRGHRLAARLPAAPASPGRTVLVSSHVLAEVEQTVDHVVIVARGRLVRACPLAELRGAARTSSPGLTARVQGAQPRLG